MPRRPLAQPPQIGRSFMFTLNNPALDPGQFGIKLEALRHFRYAVWQLEKGKNGTKHYQGYIEFKAPVRFASVKKILDRAHIEARRGTRDQAREYCMKEDTRLAGPWEAGDWSRGGQGKRNDLDDACKLIKDGKSIRAVADEHPGTYCRYHKGLEKLQQLLADDRDENVDVCLLYGPTGAGKTRSVMDLDSEDNPVFKKDGTDQWFDGYNGESVLLIDDFAGGRSKIPLSFLLNLLDRYAVRLPVKGSFTKLRAHSILITTNIHPRLWYDYTHREEHYRALKRRIGEIMYYPGHDEESYSVTPKSFWDDWYEFCDEDTVFVKRYQGLFDLTDAEAVDDTPDEQKTTQSTEELSPVTLPTILDRRSPVINNIMTLVKK